MSVRDEGAGSGRDADGEDGEEWGAGSPALGAGDVNETDA
jgi:hypothetical protein